VTLLLCVFSVSAAQAVPRLAPVQAARAAANAPAPEATGQIYLLGRLASPSAEVRLGAVYFLGEELERRPDERIAQALARVAALDPSERVRRSAGLALERRMKLAPGQAAYSGVVSANAATLR
jgi:hypothetical protein